MKASVPLYWRIHQPHRLNSRDTKKFLLLLKSSFQKHLDGSHPSVQERSKTTTEIHLDTILAAPHFNNAPKRHNLKLENTSEEKSLYKIQQLAKSPMTYFSECVSAGTATHEIAGTCLAFEFRKVLASSPARLHESLKLSGAGTIVLNWLRSSNPGESLAFLKNHRLLKMLIPFIISEGKECLIWEWLQELKTYCIIRSRSTKDELLIRKIQYHILSQTFGFEIRFGSGLNSAIKSFSQMARRIFFLTRSSTLDDLILGFMKKVPQALAVTGESIDLLVQVIDEWDTDPQYRRTLLKLYHPDKTDLASALTLLQRYPADNISTDSERRRRELIFLSFKLAESLMRETSVVARVSTHWVMKFLQDHFAKEIGFQEESDSHGSERNETSKGDKPSILQMLDALSAT